MKEYTIKCIAAEFFFKKHNIKAMHGVYSGSY